MSTDTERVQIILDDIDRRSALFRAVNNGADYIAAANRVMRRMKLMMELTVANKIEYAEQQRRAEILGDAVNSEYE